MIHGKGNHVLDGLDGCGKSTQFQELQQLLERESRKAISFPMYDKPSAPGKMYLQGDSSARPAASTPMPHPAFMP
ncbi:MAG: hypothetical protein ACLUOF_08000 [Ruminococcus sp.]